MVGTGGGTGIVPWLLRGGDGNTALEAWLPDEAEPTIAPSRRISEPAGEEGVGRPVTSIG